MFKKLTELLKKYAVVIVAGLILGSVGYNQYISITNPPELQQFKGSIQNHLVWNIKGECYFVRPSTNTTTYLIRVDDCDKGNK